jgi:hypothetical protein
VNIYSLIVEHCTPLSYSSVTHYILALNRAKLMMDSRSTPVFRAKKADNSANFTAGGIINRRAHHNSLRRDTNKYEVASYVMVYKAMSHVTLPRMRDLSVTPT